MKALEQQLEETTAHVAALRREADGYRANIGEISARKMELEGRRGRSDRQAQEKNREIL